MKCQCDKYNAAMLREPVTFERLTRTSDGQGGYTEAWAAISGAPDRAYVKAMSGSERWRSDRVEATSNYLAVVRYFAGLTEQDRIVIRSQNGQIRFINNLEFKNRWLEIDVNLGVAT